MNKSATKFPFIISLAAFMIVIAGLIYGASLITPILMALFISIICTQPITYLKKKKVPQGLAVLIVFALLIAIFFGFGDLIGSSLSSFSENSGIYEQNLDKMGTSVINFFNDKGFNISYDKIKGLMEPSKIMGFTAGALSELGGFMSNLLTILFLVLFLLLELDDISVKVDAILKDYSAKYSFFDVIAKSIRHYLSIKTLTSLLTGIVLWIILAIIGVDYAILWGLIAFLLNYIPTIGSFIAAFPAVLFALVQLGFGGALATLIAFVAVNMIIGSIVEPKLMGQGLGLSTTIVFLSLIFWGFVFGTVGMFLSVPLTMTMKIMCEQNPKTKWIAIVLGTKKDAQASIDESKPT
ncbi:MAG: AI-2E family transporter [Eudoraea sp.]|uniref:AI-2E family transporter n=1 Tax=Eudoraea sp. TaxID=1979955 RepID=UPI003C70B713